MSEFINQEKIQWDERLYIAGYSAGGFATMSLQKKIEEEASTEFNLRASSCGAGAYDKTAFMKYITTNKTTGVVGYNQLYLWTLLTYDRIYGLNRPTTQYFKDPWAAQIQSSKENANIKRIKEVRCLHQYQTLPTDIRKSSIAMFINEM